MIVRGKRPGSSSGGGGGGGGSTTSGSTFDVSGLIYQMYNSDGSWAAHDFGQLPGVPSSYSWSTYASKQLWPSDSGWSSSPYGNTWGQGAFYTSTRGVYLDVTDPIVYKLTGSMAAGTWAQVAYPNSDTSMWSDWVAPPWTQQNTGITNSRIGSTGAGQGYTRFDLSYSTSSNQLFPHLSSNLFGANRYNGTGFTAVAVECAVRIVAQSGVNLSNVEFNCGLAGDVFTSQTSAGSQANTAIGTPCYRARSNTWSLAGYVTMTMAQIQANPPPIISAPTFA